MNKQKILTLIIMLNIFLFVIFPIGAEGIVEENSPGEEGVVSENEVIVNEINEVASNTEEILILDEEMVTPSEEVFVNEEQETTIIENSEEEIIIENNESNILTTEENNSEEMIFENITSETEEISSNQTNESTLDIEVVTESSSGSTDYFELDLDNLVEEPSTGLEEVEYTYYKEGKKEIELKSFDEEKPEITKEENLKNDFEKEVVVSSDEHFENPLRVYSYLPTETEKENIEIVWKNGEGEVNGIEYYDENGNGLIDRISWIVPHLSEQIFEIIITTNNTSSSSSEILLNVKVASSINPVEFDISVDYSENFECTFSIDGNEKATFNQDILESFNLVNGTHNWELYCEDTSNSSINNSEEGEFTIQDILEFSLSEGEIFVYDQNKEEIVNPLEVNLSPESSFNKIYVKKAGGETQVFENISSLTLDENVLNSYGTYEFIASFNKPSAESNISKTFYVAEAEIITESEIETNQETEIGLEIISPSNEITGIILDSGEYENSGDLTYLNSIFQNIFNNIFDYTYNTQGISTITAYFDINGKDYSLTKEIEVISYEDDDAPDINLVYPVDEEVVNNDTIIFEYEVEDDTEIDYCNFSLYNISYSSGFWSYDDDDLIYFHIEDGLEKSEDIETGMTDFDEGYYAWEVRCYDNSSNYDFEIDYFQVSFSNDTTISLSSTADDYEKQDTVEELLIKASNFIEKEENLDVEEREAIADLGILEKVKFYKKRLIQIDQDLKYNLKYVSDSTLREQRRDEMNAEIENIEKSLPLDVNVIDSHEYIKNKVKTDLKEIVEDYMDYTNTHIGKSSIKKLAEMNSKLQQEISIYVNVKDVEIEYVNGTQTIVLVKKELEVSGDEEKVLEIIPKEIAESVDEIVFLSENEVIKYDPIVEFDIEDLEDMQIVYYIEKNLDLEDLEDTETILFNENLEKSRVGITGFFSFEVSGANSPMLYGFFGIILILMIFMGFFISKKMKIQKWKKDPNVFKAFDVIHQINKLIREKELEDARTKYRELKEIYKVLPIGTKMYFYKEIKKTMVEIDKRDIFGMIVEYEQAKREFRKDDAMRLYKDIRNIYGRLPPKYKEKAFERLNR